MKMAKAVKLADVARAAGVSQGTASNVFSRPEVVRPEVRLRVEASAKRLGYSGPDPKGRLLRGGKVNAIGVVVSEKLTDFFDDPTIASSWRASPRFVMARRRRLVDLRRRRACRRVEYRERSGGWIRSAVCPRMATA